MEVINVMVVLNAQFAFLFCHQYPSTQDAGIAHATPSPESSRVCFVCNSVRYCFLVLPEFAAVSSHPLPSKKNERKCFRIENEKKHSLSFACPRV